MNWNASMQWPTAENYILRVVEATFGQSKKDNDMVTLKSEVVSPEEVEIDGKMVNIAGTEHTTYHTVTVRKEGGEVDEEKTEAARTRLQDLYSKFELDYTTINLENVDTKPFIGKVFYAQMSADVEEKRRTPTPEQKKRGQQGDIMKNPVTGEKLINYWPKIREIFGLAPAGVASQATANKPY